MLERFQRAALGQAAVCVAQSQRLWLPVRLANWLGVPQFEMQWVSDQEVRLVNYVSLMMHGLCINVRT